MQPADTGSLDLAPANADPIPLSHRLGLIPQHSTLPKTNSRYHAASGARPANTDNASKNRSFPASPTKASEFRTPMNGTSPAQCPMPSPRTVPPLSLAAGKLP